MFDDVNMIVLIFGPIVGLVGMFSGGYWGVGCGWLVVPSMLIMGFDPSEAVGISLLQMVPSTVPTVIRTCGEIGWEKRGLGRSIILPMAIGAFLMSFSGRPINDWMYERFGASALMILFTAVMIIIGIQTAFSRAVEYDKNIRSFTGKEGMFAFFGGLATGIFSSVLGIGGALLMRPILASGFKITERKTACSIRLLLLVTTFFGGMHYVFGGQTVNGRILILAVLVSIGGMIGFPCGVRLHNIVVNNGYTQHVHKSFAAVAGIVIISTLLKLAGLHEFSRYLMLVFAVILVSYLLIFGYYAKKHPGNTLQ